MRVRISRVFITQHFRAPDWPATTRECLHFTFWLIAHHHSLSACRRGSEAVVFMTWSVGLEFVSGILPRYSFLFSVSTAPERQQICDLFKVLISFDQDSHWSFTAYHFTSLKLESGPGHWDFQKAICRCDDEFVVRLKVFEHHQANPHVHQQHFVLAPTFRSGLPPAFIKSNGKKKRRC